jgi:DNA polymerase III subunit delta'
VMAIDDAHAMNEEAQNALLKILEEPPRGVYFFLITSEQHALQATVRSRCQTQRFSELGSDDIRAILGDSATLSAAQMDSLARLARGSLSRLAIWHRLNMTTLRKRAWQLLVNERITEEVSTESKALENEEARVLIQCLIEWLHDLYLIRSGVRDSNRLFDRGRQHELMMLSKQYSRDRIERALERLALTLDDAEHALNMRLINWRIRECLQPSWSK